MESADVLPQTADHDRSVIQSRLLIPYRFPIQIIVQMEERLADDEQKGKGEGKASTPRKEFRDARPRPVELDMQSK